MNKHIGDLKQKSKQSDNNCATFYVEEEYIHTFTYVGREANV